MSELPPLGSSRRPGSPPRPEVLEAVVRAGRRRLRREAMWSAGAAASVAGVLAGVLLLGGAGEPEVLIPASPAPGVSASPGATPEPAPTPDDGTSATPPGGLPAPGPSAQAQPGRPGAGPASGPPAQTRRPAGGRAVTPYRESPEVTRGAATCPVDTVLVEGSPPGTELCLTVGKSSGSSVRSGGRYLVELRLCNALASDNAAVVRFATGREHDLAVERAGARLWTWSAWHTFPQGPHSRVIERGDCLAWQTTWDTRDDAGRLVRPGTYDVVPSAEVNGRTESIRMRVEVTR